MPEDLDIIPILVIAASQNHAEMLNGLLRSHGVAVHASWTDRLDGWDKRGSAPEVILYFSEIEKPRLEDVIAQAAPSGTPVVVVARERSATDAARAMEAGAADWVGTEEGELMAAVVRRERSRRHGLRRLLELEQAVDQHQLRLKSLISGSQEAIAYLQDGVIVDANTAWAARFSGEHTENLIGSPIMDLFGENCRGALKKALKAVARDSGPQTITLDVLAADGDTQSVNAELSQVPSNGHSQVQLTIRGQGPAGELQLQIEELEQDKQRLAEEIQDLDQRERGTKVLWPATFAPIAAERLNRPLGGLVRALVAFRPSNPTEVTRLLGPLGIAMVGSDLSAVLSPLLEEGDIATRLDSLVSLALVNRESESALRAWIESALRALGSQIFETGSRSTHLGFVAGFAVVDRVRQLDVLVNLALGASEACESGIHRAQPETRRAATELASSTWESLIPEAFKERRFVIALQPIEDLARGAKLYVASPRLLDSSGNEIAESMFYQPAVKLGLLESLERRLLGHAFVAQLRLQHAGESKRMLVPLSAAAIKDSGLPTLLVSLGKHVKARSALKSLVLEFCQNDIATRIREVERFARAFGKLGCGLGMRDFDATSDGEQLLEDLAFATLRLAPKITDQLAHDEALRDRLRAVAKRCSKKDVMVIASGVSDANAMALLYNLGIGLVDGPVIGEPTLFSPAASEDEPLLRELNAGLDPRSGDRPQA